MRSQRTRLLAVAATAAAALAMCQAASAGADPATGAQQQQPLTADQAQALAQDANTSVIVVLRNQPAAAAKNTPAASSRAGTIAAAQAPVVSELTQVHAQHVRSYRLADAVAATVSSDEATRLAANPNVAAVIPDSVLRIGHLAKDSQAGTAAPAASADIPGVCAPGGGTLLEPEALSVTHTASQDPHAQTAQSLGITGSGVKVGYIADGIDVNNPDFIRADGSHVFADYQDFTGDGPGAPTSGAEAFIDASAIAAQGRQTYNVQNFGAVPLSQPCNIRVQGMAPGASLYGYNVFPEENFPTTSAILQAIDFAVQVDHVDVLNESFGFDPQPDHGSQDAVRLFNDAAVAAGVTVTVSSGDAGVTSTQGSPSTDPAVISTGASTTFRWYAQTAYAGTTPFAPGGWLNDNISQLSSSGFNQDGRSIDLLAPGDLSWALCTADADLFGDCVDFLGRPSPVERSGGTSESAPLTAGASALVIQAYRQTHGGTSPTPAQVKQLLTSTADDLAVPGDEQGAGRLNSYKAVLAAKSVRDQNGSPAATGSTLLVDNTQLDASGTPGSLQHWQVKVTNNGAGPQDVALSGRTFGAAQTIKNGSVTLNDTASPHFTDFGGVNNNYGTVTFTVAPHTDRLTASIAYPGNPDGSLNGRVRMILVDPQQRLAVHSIPQGVGNYGFGDVRFPTPGTWTAVIFSRDSAHSGTLGTIPFRAQTANITGFGSVSPSGVHLNPGQSRTVTVTARTPAGPGDASGSLVLDAGAGGRTSVPIIVRSLIDVAHGGAFNGVLTGGNGRQPNLGQTNYYQFDVPAGRSDIEASVDLTNDAGDNVVAVLVDPSGNAVATGTNRLTTSYNPTDRTGDQQALTQTDLYARTPKAGRWTLIVNFAGAVVGDELSQPFHGSVGFNKVDVHANGLPNSTSTTLRAGTAVTIPVTVHNTGTAAENFFVDPRLNTPTLVTLAAAAPTSATLPISADVASPAWLVPTESTGALVVAHASVPVGFDYGPQAGDPDLPSNTTGKTAIGAVFGNPLPSGVWGADPAELGPAPVGGYPAGTVDMSLQVLTKPFDATVTSPATNLWRSSVAPATSMRLITVQPGQTVTIPVTITPTGTRGTVVRGTLYVDNLVVGSTAAFNAINYNDFAPTEPNANELIGIPYTYTIG